MCSGKAEAFSDDVAAQLTPSNFSLTIGSKQMKVMFEEYTDATFTKKVVSQRYIPFLLDCFSL